MTSRTVLVTGASSGIGAAVARRFAAEGARLVVCARRLDRLEALRGELGVPTYAFALDVRDRDAVFREIAQIPAEFASIDVLVNNAGLALGLEPAHEAKVDDWEEMIDANVKGLTWVTRAVLPGMTERERGDVVMLGSVAGEYPYPGGNVYGATKAYVHQFALNLRADLLGKNVRVTSIEPGMVKDTAFSNVRFHGDDARAAKVYEGVQALTPDDVAETVWWVTSLPRHVNVNRLEVMATVQAFGGFALKKS